MITGNSWKPERVNHLVNHLRSTRASATASPDAPSTLMELVGIVLDPQIHTVVRKAPGTPRDLRPRLLIKQSA